MSGLFDPKLFFQDATNVALHVAASELFGLLKRSLDLPAQWSALVRRPTGAFAVVPASGTVESADVEDVLFVRVTPIEVEVHEEDLITCDRFQCRARVRLRVCVIPERSELQSFLKAIVGSHRVAQARTLVRYLQPAVRAALAKLAAAHEATDLADGRMAEEVSAALTEALQAPLFASGLTLDSQPSASIESQTLRQVQLSEQEAARRRAEHDAARQVQQALERAQSEHLDHLASLLGRLNELATASPAVELPELLRTFSERQRGELYEALFSGEPDVARTRWIVVAAGPELLFFDPVDLESPCRRLTITGDAGAVRSIQTATDADGHQVLLLGAATGVYRLPIDRAEPDLTLRVEGASRGVPTPSVRGGFNAVALVGDRLVASHSELGIHEWRVNEPGPSKPCFASLTQQARAVRGVQFFDGFLYCSIDNRAIRWPADAGGTGDSWLAPVGNRCHTEPVSQPHSYTGSTATLTGLCPTPDGLFAGNVDGDILHWPKDGDTKPERIHTGTHRAAESIWLLLSHGVKRLIYSDTSLHVHARVLGDNYTCRYEAGGQTLRRVEVAPDILVATNDLRDRLICWKPGEPGNPRGTISVSRLCGHSVQDVCLVQAS